MLVGGALARWWGTACELQQLWVDEMYRRRGIGADFVRLVERHAIEQGCAFEVLPLPYGRPKQALEGLIPDALARLCTNRLRMGSFLVAQMRKA